MLHPSVTRRRTIRIAERARAAAPVAVVAASEAEAASAARAIRRRLPGVVFAPASLDGYLRALEAPRRVVLCVTNRSASRARGFIRRAAGRLLWPAPSADILDAVAGLRPVAASVPRLGPAPPARVDGARSALLLEGTVDARRARTALRSAPREWIVESARHVRVGARAMAALTRAGVAWSALDPVELFAIYAEAPLPPDLGLPPEIPVWIRARPGAWPPAP